MKAEVNLDSAYVPSDNIVAREIEGELIIVPLVAGIGDMENELYTLNETGKAIWDKLDGRNKLKDVVERLSDEFAGSVGDIEADVLGLTEELMRRKMIIPVAGI